MGARFNFRHANLVAYLTAEDGSVAPRTTDTTVKTFLESLCYQGALISSTMGTPRDWTRNVSAAAEYRFREFGSSPNDRIILESDEVAWLLAPLKGYFTGYDLYALVLPSGSLQQDHESFKFFTEAAVSSHSKGLVLMPEYDNADQLAQVVDPFPAMRAIAESPIAPPAVAFWTRLGNSCVLSLAEAMQFFRSELLGAMEGGGMIRVDRALEGKARRQRAKRILHLSDLHFGTKEATRRRAWLKEQLTKELPAIDRVVVTGDLFNDPSEPLRESFDEFRIDIENLTHKGLIVIPGNHDVRRKGNAWGPIGRNSEFVTDLRWDPVTFDDDLQTAIFSFNSSETGDFAKGSVSERQRLNCSLLFDREVRIRPTVREYMKIALVHHHPYAYGAKPTALYERILAGLFGSDEAFVAFEDADAFINWCAARGVSLVLHGHKHVPHLRTAVLEAHGQRVHLTVVGCGSTTGVDKKPMCYDIVTLDPQTKRWSVSFYHDENGDGSGFRLQNVAVNIAS
jgi:predicted phosphodiesterase